MFDVVFHRNIEVIQITPKDAIKFALFRGVHKRLQGNPEGRGKAGAGSTAKLGNGDAVAFIRNGDLHVFNIFRAGITCDEGGTRKFTNGNIKTVFGFDEGIEAIFKAACG